jgi:hypothetical protein
MFTANDWKPLQSCLKKSKNDPYFGSQWAIVKAKVNLVTNMSFSSLTSCTLGGGKAIATPTYPITDGFIDVDSCGLIPRNLPSNNTT